MEKRRSVELGVGATMAMEDPAFASLLWKMTPASMAVRISNGAWKAWPFLQLLSRKLVDVASGRCKRLIVTMPPRHGKSLMVSQWLPLWFLENFPEKKVILCSYEMDFAAKWGGRVRDLISDNQDLLNARFKAKMPAMHGWELEEGGGMSCAGAGGPITGKGADLLILDDILKNSEDAESLNMREKIWEWWLSTARTRIEPGGSAVVMMTRWHQDDLIGRLINPDSYPEKGMSDEWEVYDFPALSEPESEAHYAQFGVKVNDLRLEALSNPLEKRRLDETFEWHDILGRTRGEALCPDRYNEEDLAKIRGGSSEKFWFAMYQQRPGDEAEVGNVYHCFDDRTHLRETSYNSSWQLFISLDFNVDPMCCVVGQYDQGSGLRGMERCEILEEVVLPESNTYAMCETLMLRLQKYRRGYTLNVEVYGDCAGTQRTANSRKTNWQIVAEHFRLDPTLHTRFIRKKANPNIVDRINAVNSMLKSADGTVRLFLDYKGCPELVRDLMRVKWQTDSGGNYTGLLDKRDKKRTHVSDALGYAIEYKFGLTTRSGGRPGMLM